MATLVYSDVDGVDRSFALGNEPVMVGRGPECGIRSQDPRVSRMHARFFVEAGTLWVEDLGSSNGIFVGPNKVQRAPVPTGEIMLIGSLVIRLLPMSGTLPPPMGLHGTLASWLDLERKTRAAVEDERDAFAKRVGELHVQIAAIKLPDTLPPDVTAPGGLNAEAIRLRDEAEARAAALERALAAVQDELTMLRQGGVGRAQTNDDDAEDAGDTLQIRGELGDLRAKIRTLEQELAERADWSSNLDLESTKMVHEVTRLQAAVDEAEKARSIAEHAHGEAMREAQTVREELDQLRRASAAELEIARLDLSKSREVKMMAETAVGIATAEKLAEADLVISGLQREIATLKTAATGPEARTQVAVDQVTTLTAKIEKIEKDLAAAQIRAQGAERNLSGAGSQAAKAETKAALLEHKVADAEAKVKAAEHDVAKALERVAALETRLGAGDAPLQAAETRAAKIAAELAEMTGQFETRRDRVVELEKGLFAAGEAVKASEAKVVTAKAELAEVAAKHAAAETRAAELKARLDQLGAADTAIAAATKARDEAAAKLATADKRVSDAERRAADAEQRASAADTMAKAMAKDVAEALRRAADTDNRAKTVHRDLADAIRRADQAEARSAEGATSIKDVERRATDAEARVATIQQELTAKLEATQQELTTKLEVTQRELTIKLEAAQRELAAERSTSISIIDRKTSIERELAEARRDLPALKQRADEAEAKLLDAELQVEALQDRVTDLESGVAVSETAAQSSLDDARDRIRSLEGTLGDTTRSLAKSVETTEQLRGRIAELESQLHEAAAARQTTEAALHEAHQQIAALVRANEERAGASDDDQDRLADALARASDAERKIDALSAKAEAADLAIGRAGALQRQLDEAITKLAWLEREASNKGRDQKAAVQSEAMVAERIGAAEMRVKDAEARVRELENRMREADAQIREADAKVESADEELADMSKRMVDTEQTARELERRLADVTAKLAEATTQLAALQKEVDAAENVRSFAAETEREIAQLQRDLRDARSKATQMTLERDRLASELKDARGDTDTTNRRMPVAPPKPGYDPEVTAQADLKKYESMIQQSTDLQEKVRRLEREDAQLRKMLTDAEGKLRDAVDRPDEEDSESTRTGSQLPIVLAEHVNVLEESIDSLRSNMRAASDETAMMDQSDSVIAISSAVSQAQEHVERARAAIKLLAAAIGMNS